MEEVPLTLIGILKEKIVWPCGLEGTLILYGREEDIVKGDVETLVKPKNFASPLSARIKTLTTVALDPLRT